MDRVRLSLIKIGAVVSVLFFMAAPAAASDRLVEFGVWYVWFDPAAEGTFTAGDPAEPFDAAFDSDTGYGVSAALFFGRRISAEFAVAQAKSPIALKARDREANLVPRQTTLTPITGTLQLHLRPDAMIDPYIGAGAMYLLFEDVKGGREGQLGVAELESSDVAWLVNFGVSVELSETLGLLIDAKYVPSEISVPATLNDAAATQSDIKFTPLTVSVGLSYRWGR